MNDIIVREYTTALEILLKKPAVTLPHTIIESIVNAQDLQPDVLHWKESGVLLHLCSQVGIAAHLRYVAVHDFFTKHSDYIIPAVTSIYWQGTWQQIAIMSKKGSVLRCVILSNQDEIDIDEKVLVDTEKKAYQIALDHEIEKSRTLLAHAGVEPKQIDKCLQKYGSETLLLVAEYLEVVALEVQGRKELACHLLEHPELASTLSAAHHVRTILPNHGLPVIVAEGGIGFIAEVYHKEPLHHKDHEADHHHLTPVERAVRYIRFEQKDIWIVIAYSIIIGLVSLVTPLSVNAIVSTISAGIYTLPLLVLSGLIFFGLLFSGFVSIVQMYVVEVIQQRLFVNTAFEISYKLPKADYEAMEHENVPELLNRFFDILTLQKSVSKILIDGLGALIIGVAGLALLAFVSPILLTIGIILLVFSGIMIYVLGRGALKTSINESKKKYDVAGFLEDIGRSMLSFKLTGTTEFIFRRIDSLLHQYLKHRRSHFHILVRQLSGFAVLRSVINTSVLAIGGILVIERQITLGQLVATEIVIVSLIAALEKLFRQLEVVYDALTSLDKVGHVTDIPLERVGGTLFPQGNSGIAVETKSVSYSYDSLPVLHNLTLFVPSGARASLVGKSGAGKSTLAHLLIGVIEAKTGTVLLNDYDTRVLDLSSLRRNIGLVLPNDEIIEGTVYENIVMGRPWVSPQDVMNAIRLTHLDETFLRLPQGLQTHLISFGKNLSTGEIRRLMIARAIVHSPRLLVLDEPFTGIEENLKIELMQKIFDKNNPWTIIAITHDPEVVAVTDMMYVLRDGAIVEQGIPTELANDKTSECSHLFPDLSSFLDYNLQKGQQQ